jgi:hypothetical protein
LQREIGNALAFWTEVALSDPGALTNPFVVRVENAREILIRVRAAGDVVTGADDGKTMARRGKSGSSSSGVQRYQGALLRGSSV